MDYSALTKQIKKQLPGIDVHLNHPLAPYTTLKIGGPADLFINSTSHQQFISILKLLHQTKTPPPFIIGNGSNLLISDSGIRGIVIKNSNNHIDIHPSTAKATLSSGTSLPSAIKHLNQKNLVGLEEFAYIPATIGGAIHSNIHGVNQTDFSHFLKSVVVFNYQTGKTTTLPVTDPSSNWDYDQSPFQKKPHLIILSTTINLKQGDGKKAQKTAKNIIKKKTKTQPLPSAGCTFKNPIVKTGAKPPPAGQLIDRLNLKGTTINNIQISRQHANFIINTDPTTTSPNSAANYIKLVRLIQQKVKINTVLT